MKKYTKKVTLIVVLVVLVLVGASYIYLVSGQYQPSAEAMALSEQLLTDSNDQYLSYETESEVGLIMYQGAKVEPEAYTYLTDTGYNLYVSDFPYNIAFLDTDVATQIIDENPQVTSWYIVGHSLGGTLAYDYATKDMAGKVDGVIMLGSYPLSDVVEAPNFDTLAIFAQEDGLITDYVEKLKMYGGYAEEYVIEGANHAGFGDYGDQANDNPATITLEEQHQLIVDKIVEFVNKK